MNAYVVILIGLTSAMVLIGVYGYIDYMSGRHISDMYSGLRGMMDSLKERIRILEDTVESMKRNGDREIMKDMPKNAPEETQKESPFSGTVCLEKKERVTITEPMDVIDPKF